MRLLLLLILFGPTPLLAEFRPIPEPLTLAEALTFAESDHPDLQLASTMVGQSQARLAQARDEQGWRVDLNGRIRWKSLQNQPGKEWDDHQLSLSARKPLYDFGRSALTESIAGERVAMDEVALSQTLSDKKLEIMERFFAVLLADLQRTVDDEAMTIAFLRHQKKVDQEITGDYSELDLLQDESTFEDARVRMKQSEMVQRLTRQRLAEAMNRPGEVPSSLIAPAVTPDQVLSKLQNVKQLQQQAQQDNPELHQARQQVRVAEQHVELARLGGAPEIDAAVEVLDHAFVTGSKDRWRASIEFAVPLWDGGVNRQEVAESREALRAARATLEQLKRTVDDEVSRNVLELQVLEAQWRADQVAIDYREVELERNRALYEQEQQSNLGDALVGISKSHLRTAESRFKAMLIQARLNRLMGKEIGIDE